MTGSDAITLSELAVRFDGWQSTIAGDQEVRKALGYVREYY